MSPILRPLILFGSLAFLQAEEETALPARAWHSPGELLCASLTAAIEERPDQMLMRLEDALVINEAAAADIVTAAMNAVQGRPHLTSQILTTALKVAPARAASIRQAVAGYRPIQIRTAMAVGGAVELLTEAADETPPPVEVRRAELPGAPDHQPIEEIRRASLPGEPAHALPHEEIRRPELPGHLHAQ